LKTTEVHTGSWWGGVRERGHLEDLGIHGRLILKWIIKNWDRGMDWIDLAQDRNRWSAIVNTVMNTRITGGPL